MKKQITLSLALLATISSISYAKTATNAFRTKAGHADARPINQSQTGAKTNALSSRLVSTAYDTYGTSSFTTVDSGKLVYSPSGLRGSYNDLWQDWDYDTSYNYSFSGGMAELSGRFYNVYNSNNLPTLMVGESFDGTNWTMEERTTITYDANKNVASVESESNNGNGLEKEYKVNATYNTSNQIVTSTEQEWDAMNTIYKDAFRTTYTYNTHGDATQELYEEHNGAWANSGRTSYTYDANFNNTEILSENYNAGNFEPSYRTQNVFDASNNNTVSTSDFYMTGTWITVSKYINTYDANHNQITSENYNFNGTTLEPSSLSDMTYNNYSQMLTSTSKIWEPVSMQYKVGTGSSNQRMHYEEFTLGVKDLAKTHDGNLTVFPVPAGNTVNLKLNLEQPQGIFIMLQDASGKIVQRWNEAAGKQFAKQLSLDNIAPGNYIIRVIVGGQQYQQKISVIR
ncbi:MAG: T9SS type A sorting domain-containing protein [Sphingobacteriales bacterium]|nr:MAG: T9SS type A sorting domain-containing protein [Sphingobacteriales bacterium]